jgi:hypothetical protein
MEGGLHYLAKCNRERHDSTAQSAPNGFRRVAWLPRALRDPDESVRDWKNCRRPYFSDFICSAIRESGFVDPIVARYAIAAVLAVIETQGPVMERS